MLQQSHIILSSKLLETCGCDKSASIYSLLPHIDDKPEHCKGVYAHTLENLPRILDCGLEILGNKRLRCSKTSYEYERIKEEEGNFIDLFSKSRLLMNEKSITNIESNKVNASLSALFHIYLDTFYNPVQFFIPHTSTCSGQWGFWNDINYLDLKEKLTKKKLVFSFIQKILKSKVWSQEFKPNEFPLIVKRRLLKERAFSKKLSPESMIKAIIVRISELGKPNIDYGIVDYSIRNLFTYLNVKRYLRIDREILFLKRFEKEVFSVWDTILRS